MLVQKSAGYPFHARSLKNASFGLSGKRNIEVVDEIPRELHTQGGFYAAFVVEASTCIYLSAEMKPLLVVLRRAIAYRSKVATSQKEQN